MTQSFEAGLKWLRGLHLALWQRIRDLGILVLDPPHCSRSKGLIVKSLEIEREEKGFGKRDRDTDFPTCQNDVYKEQTLQQRPKTLDQYSPIPNQTAVDNPQNGWEYFSAWDSLKNTEMRCENQNSLFSRLESRSLGMNLKLADLERAGTDY